MINFALNICNIIMKRKLFTLLTLLSVSLLAYSHSVEYNRWSIDLNGGLTKPSNPFIAGFYAKTFGFVHGDLGVRYMFNPKFGIKADFGYDQFEVQSASNRDGKIMRTNLQGVINLGESFKF